MANKETIHEAAVVPHESRGISSKHLFLEPPIRDPQIAERIAVALCSGAYTLKDEKGRTKFILGLDNVIIDTNEELIVKASKAVAESGVQIVPMEGLPFEPGAEEYAIYRARRNWAAAA
jgi:hypothetical protein